MTAAAESGGVGIPRAAALLFAIASAGCASGPAVTASLSPSDADVSWFFDVEIDEDGTVLDPHAWPWVEGRADLGGREFRFVVRDARRPDAPDDLSRVEVVFDRDGDGRFDADKATGEGYAGDARFDLGTGTFRVAAVDAASITFAPAWPAAATRPFLGVGDPAPPLPPKDLEGRPLSWEEFRGRSVLLVFWSST